ncbi:MAG: hypothetical protein ABL955_12150, partial [Elusimicrobiota bacterium]
MKMILLPLLLCALPAFGQNGDGADGALVAPPTEVQDAAKKAADEITPKAEVVTEEPKGPPRPSMLEDKKEEPKPEPKV